MKQQRVALITGASSGIGRACAAQLSQHGWRVFGTSRKPADTTPWTMILMDVDDDASVQRGVAAVLAQMGRIDLVVNNAGFGYTGAIEDTTIAEARTQFETNLFGVWRVCQAVLPTMRQQRAGHIVTISSINGLIGVPFQGAYCASKFALEGLMETLRMEVKPWNIQVALVEPGDFNTGFTAQRRPTAHISAVYQARYERALNVIEHDEQHGASPEPVAVLVVRIADTRRPRLRYRIGPLSNRLAVTLRRVLPDNFFEWGLMLYYRVSQA